MDTDARDDRDLWRAAIDHDGRAFAELFDRHRDRVFRHILKFLPAADAEDATAVTFLELWRLRAKVCLVDDSIRPWLLVTAGNVARNKRRSSRRYRAFLASLPSPENQADLADASADRMDSAALTKDLKEAMRRLAKTDQDLIRLTVLEDVPLEHASAALGLTYGAAKTRLSRARVKLRATTPQGEPERSAP